MVHDEDPAVGSSRKRLPRKARVNADPGSSESPTASRSESRESSSPGSSSGIHRHNATTLHDLYTVELQDLKKKSQSVLHLQSRRDKLSKHHAGSENDDFHSLRYEDHLRAYAERSELERLDRQLQRVNDGTHVTDYFMDTADILHQYYCNIDSISSGNDAMRKRHISREGNGSGGGGGGGGGGRTVLNFLDKSARRDPTVECDVDGLGNNGEKPAPASRDTHGDARDYQSRDVLLQRYRAIMDDEHIMYDGNGHNIDIISHPCPSCGHERSILMSEASTVCTKCSRIDPLVVDSNKPSYKDPPRDNHSYYSYKRINHFNEWLAQFQAKETTEIPDEVYDWILLELRKERRHNERNISASKMKSILKKLRLNKYYEHIPHITNRLNGQVAPVMDRVTEEKLRSMFKEIQAPFIKHCPSERKNFLSYSYVLHKFCELLNLDQFLPCFQLLKSREKLHQQDRIWKRICEELQWEFIKSI
jgi:hypothetical protein